jgi:hypothetical protein
MPRPLPPPLAPATPPPFGPFPACFHARSRSALPLADEPTPPTSCSLSRAHSRWQTGPTGQPLRRPPRLRLVAVTSDRRPLHRPSPRRTEEFGTAPSSPLDRVLARYRPRRAVLSSPLCGIKRRRCAPHRPPPSSTAPLPSGTYKRAAPSTPLPRTSLSHPSFPSPELNSRKRRRLLPLW